MLSSTIQLDLSIETLEQRLNLAGNIAVGSLANGDLLFRGDGSDNSMVLERQADGNIWAHGTDGTTVNGVDVGLLISDGAALDRGVTFRMRGGDDSIALNNLEITGRLDIDMGGADDTVLLDEIEMRGKATINLRSGHDAVTLIRFAGYGDLNIQTGAGHDGVSLLDRCYMETARFELDTASGNDSLWIDEAAFFGDVFVAMGTGSDSFEAINRTWFAGDLTVRLGSGDDSLRMSSLYYTDVYDLGSLDLDTGGGDDLVSLKNQYAQRGTQISTRGGNDLVAISGSTFLQLDGADYSLDLQLGGGADGLLIDATIFGSASIDSGASGDLLLVGGNLFEAEMEIQSGSGQDILILNRWRTQQSLLSVDLGSQNDQLYSAMSIFPLEGELSGGAGRDTAQSDHTGVWPLQLYSFEQQLPPQPMDDVVLGGIVLFGSAWTENGGLAGDLVC